MQKEKNNLVVPCSRDEIRVELIRTEDSCRLDTNIYEFLKDFTGKTVSTDVLGKAFEPEEKFENPDGTPILFDSDYFGNHRGLCVIPGPFADAAASKKPLF